MSVNCLVASPLANGLFNKAIAESGGQVLEIPARESNALKQAEQKGLDFAKAFNTTSIAALRRMPASELQKKSQGFSPIVDGHVLPESIQSIFKNNKQNDVALLTGWNENEGIIFGEAKNAVDFQSYCKETYGKDAEVLLKYYPGSNDETALESQLKLSRDMIFGVQNYTWANMESKQGKKVYVYRFTRKVPATGEYVKYGAFHTGEVPYVFNNLKFVDRPWEISDRKMADIISSYWVNFASSGNPNGMDLPKWPQYDYRTRQIMQIDKEFKSVVMADHASLDFLYGMLGGK
jgi:para-nitrobenzyl esterase